MSYTLYFVLIIVNFLSLSFTNKDYNNFNYGIPKRSYIQENDKLKLDSLLSLYGHNKILPKGFELQALIALSHYPELKNIQIEFRFKKAKIAHTCRPSFLSTFKNKNKRKYIVTISNVISKDLEMTRLKNLSYNAQIGVLGHELGHVSEYIQFNFCKLISYGVNYSNEKGIIEIENRTDKITIDHGLGFQLLEWSTEVHDFHIKDGRGDRYLAPSEIHNEISRNKLYNNI